VSRMVDRMDVGHYRPGCLSAAEEEAIERHHHLSSDAIGPDDLVPGSPPEESRPLLKPQPCS
jgi:hypothetical protein